MPLRRGSHGSAGSWPALWTHAAIQDRGSSLTSLHGRFKDRPHAGVVSCNAPSHWMHARIGIRRNRRYLRTLGPRCQLLLRKVPRSRNAFTAFAQAAEKPENRAPALAGCGFRDTSSWE